MKKQKNTTIDPKQMPEMVQNHRMKHVAPPAQAARGPDGKYSVNRAEAAQYWFKAAKEQHPDKGFLGIEQREVKAQEATDREMLYKGKKKEIVKE